MKIQIDFPDNWDKLLKIYQINGDFKTKAEALTDLAKKQLQAEKDMFTMTDTSNVPDYTKNI